MIGMDKITEEISHFIGIFHTSIEQARLRESYEDFAFRSQRGDVPSDLLPDRSFEAPYELLGYDPLLNYRPVAPIFPPLPIWNVEPRPIAEGPDADTREVNVSDQDIAQRAPMARMGGTLDVPPIDPVGSVANYLQQNIILSDNDVFSVGGHELTVSGTVPSAEALLEAAEAVVSLSPLSEIEAPGSSAEMIALIKAVAEALDVAASGDAGLVAAQATTLNGAYVNGELVEEAPRLEDYYSFAEEDDDAAEEPEDTDGPRVVTDGELPEASVTITMGDNVLINDAVVKSLWAGAKVTAVVGDHIEVNAIIQINAVWDADDLGAELASWAGDDLNEMFNIASFERTDDGGTTGPQAASDQFPTFWSVTEITGDLIVTNWIEQYVFMSDQDVGIVSASGGEATIVGGGNTGINHVSLAEIGFGYDLIVIGGSVYDASIIEQINVLFDSDRIDGVGGFGTNGSGSASSSGNLLWNEATIYNMGGADRFADLPADYLDAALSMANGDADLSPTILNDPAFAGLVGLRVLYISGDLINLQYIRQANILGDDDQIALAMDRLLPNADANFTVQTGGNVLINNAAILDLDAFGQTYVGGEHYSQETLIQAGFVSSHPDLGGQDPAFLANEAVLFLDDSMLDGDSGPEPGVYVPADHGQGQDDGLQAILAH